MKLSKQNEAILAHMRAEGSITNLEAHIVHKIRSLSSRVSELRAAGYVIAKERHEDVTGQWYIRYVLLGRTVPACFVPKVNFLFDNHNLAA